MGEAFTAFAEGPSAAYWNPAALGFSPGASRVEIMPYSFSWLVPDLASDIWIYSGAAAFSRRWVGAGFNLNYLSYGEVPLGESHEYTLHLGSGLNLTRLLMPEVWWVDLGLGASWRYANLHFAPDILTSSPATHGTGSDLDLGTLLVLRQKHAFGDPRLGTAKVALRLGFVVGNVFDHDVEFDNGTSDPMGRRTAFGAGLEASVGNAEPFGDLIQLRLGFDAKDLIGKAGDARSFQARNYGLEVVVLELVSARYGYVNNSGDIEDSTYGFGVGHHLGHRFAGRFDFGSRPEAEGLQRVEQYSVSGWAQF